MSISRNKDQQPQLSRRALFTGLTQRVQQSLEVQETVQRTVPRPPNAVDEDIFTRLCNQCGECEKACPESVIRLEHGFPTLDLEYSHCSLCGQCQNVCPTPALSHTHQDIGLRARVAETCINAYGFCDACQNSCTSQALEWRDGQHPSINNDQCSGCGVCQSDCYLGAIHLISR